MKRHCTDRKRLELNSFLLSLHVIIIPYFLGITHTVFSVVRMYKPVPLFNLFAFSVYVLHYEAFNVKKKYAVPYRSVASRLPDSDKGPLKIPPFRLQLYQESVSGTVSLSLASVVPSETPP